MKRRMLLGWFAIALALASSVLAPIRSTSAQTPAQTVRLIIDYGDGAMKVYNLPWTSGITILDVMNSAKAHPRGITFNYTGSGATAFLTDIDGLMNQGGGADKKNWQYWVNTSYGDRSFGAWNVQALDTVIWSFALYQGK